MNKNKLHNIKNPGFKTPKDYFEGLEDSVMDQIKLQDKITDIGFKVPDNYFDSFEDKVLDRITKKPKVISLFTKRNLFYASSIAAALVLMFSIFINKNDLSFDDLEITSIENYIYEQDIDTYDMASLLTEEELITDNFIESELTEDLLKDYLLENATLEDLIIE